MLLNQYSRTKYAYLFIISNIDRAHDGFLKVGRPKNVLSREAARNIFWALLGGLGACSPREF